MRSAYIHSSSTVHLMDAWSAADTSCVEHRRCQPAGGARARRTVRICGDSASIAIGGSDVRKSEMSEPPRGVGPHRRGVCHTNVITRKQTQEPAAFFVKNRRDPAQHPEQLMLVSSPG